MKHHGVLYKGEMVRALLRDVDTKSQTRRLRGLEEINEEANAWTITHQGIEETTGMWCVQFDRPRQSECVRAPYTIGDLLYAKETFAYHICANKDGEQIHFQADSKCCPNDGERLKWKSSLFMPKALSRIWLEVTAVRCERVQSITDSDAIAEGIESQSRRFQNSPGYGFSTLIDYKFYGSELERLEQRTTNPVWSYETLWDTINTKPGTTWQDNPWVWVYEFERIDKPPIDSAPMA